MKRDVYNVKHEVVGQVDLNSNIFEKPVRIDILSRVIEWQLAKRRSGTHKTKQIAEISGTGKKFVRQKGSGGARHGSRRAPQFRGGAVIFGPVVRSHEYSLPKKIRKLGLMTALSEKLSANNLFIIDTLKFDTYKTKDIKAFLDNLKARSTLLIDSDDIDTNLRLSVRNLHNVNALPQIGANVYDIMHCDKLIISLDALKSLEARLS
ncbi:MAG: 50S ribosomal protein L4 [Proteobacteria bacterium]|nr:50S ribosomal protein L4 [Pseudomonadota bacterium]